jgi:NAD-dependent deacetylase
LVYPAAGFSQRVKRGGGALIEIDPYETELTSLCDVSLRRKAAEVLPQLVGSIEIKLGAG